MSLSLCFLLWLSFFASLLREEAFPEWALPFFTVTHRPFRLLSVNPAIPHAQGRRRLQHKHNINKRPIISQTICLFIMVKTYCRPGEEQSSNGWIILIIGTHEKLHAEPIRKISHLLHFAKIDAPTTQMIHPRGQSRILHLLRPKSLVRARQTHSR